MSKKAFCVGINDYPFEGNDLKGCVNDAEAWAALLKDHFDFTDVKTLTDKNATKANIVAGIKNLLAGAKSGDILVFTNASHGTYVADTDGDEPGYDEALCPYDTDSNLLIDDELREIFTGIPSGVMLTVVSDSCHSGSVTRVLPGQAYRKARKLEPVVWGGKELTSEEMRAARKLQKGEKEKFPESGMREILLSGCKSNQTSADAFIANTFRGAMSYYAIKAITDANYKLTYEQLHNSLLPMLEDESYEQVPQLEGNDENKKRQIFT
ncbi:MAG: caspase family protein [Pyrinomonadaceae bacterium]